MNVVATLLLATLVGGISAVVGGAASEGVRLLLDRAKRREVFSRSLKENVHRVLFN